MATPDDPLRLGHMLEAARKAVQFLAGRDRAELDRDEMRALAVIRLIEIIGEAARLVSPEFRGQHLEIEWTLIIAARNRLTHGYAEVDLGVVWEIVRDDLPPLIARLENLTK